MISSPSTTEVEQRATSDQHGKGISIILIDRSMRQCLSWLEQNLRNLRVVSAGSLAELINAAGPFEDLRLVERRSGVPTCSIR